MGALYDGMKHPITDSGLPPHGGRCLSYVRNPHHSPHYTKSAKERQVPARTGELVAFFSLAAGLCPCFIILCHFEPLHIRISYHLQDLSCRSRIHKYDLDQVEPGRIIPE